MLLVCPLFDSCRVLVGFSVARGIRHPATLGGYIGSGARCRRVGRQLTTQHMQMPPAVFAYLFHVFLIISLSYYFPWVFFLLFFSYWCVFLLSMTVVSYYWAGFQPGTVVMINKSYCHTMLLSLALHRLTRCFQVNSMQYLSPNAKRNTFKNNWNVLLLVIIAASC